MLKQWKFNGFLAIVMILLWTLSVTVPSYAKGGGHGMGGGHGRGAVHGMDKGAISEKDEAQGTAEGAIPPGLAKEGKMPYGLEKQGKTPAGWSKGKKKGWKKQIKKEGKKESAEAEKHEKEKE